MSKLTEGKTDNLNRPQYIKEIESIINKLSKQTVLGTNEFTGECYQTFKQEILYNLFHNIEAERIHPNSFYKATIILVPKTKTPYEKNIAYQSIININAKILKKI